LWDSYLQAWFKQSQEQDALEQCCVRHILRYLSTFENSVYVHSMYSVPSVQCKSKSLRSGLLQLSSIRSSVRFLVVELRPPFAVSIIVRLAVIGWSCLARHVSRGKRRGIPTRVDRAATVQDVRRSWLILRSFGV
jgi:hypothetical protein